MNIYKDFKPTRLIIKRHTVTGLLYFCKTTKQNIKSYHGSGKYWKEHLTKHGKTLVETIWVSDWFNNRDDLVDFALSFSELFNIVESGEWANLKPENGIDGGGSAVGIANQKATISDPEWKRTIGAKRSQQARDSILKTMGNDHWRNTVGVMRVKKQVSKKLSDEWRETVGKERDKKAAASCSATMNSDEWKLKTYKTCEFCGCWTDPGKYSRWHGKNCSANPTGPRHKE